MARKQKIVIAPKTEVSLPPPALVEDLRRLIAVARRNLATTLNAGLDPALLAHWQTDCG